MDVVPFTAWEQAALIGLFIVFVSVLLAWFNRQSDKWQKFMFDIDDKWRTFNQQQREENNCAMADVNRSLTDLTQVTQALVSEVKEMRSDTSVFFRDFADHDEQAKEILNEVKNGKTTTRTRKPKAEQAE